MSEITGGCLCRAVRWTCTAQPVVTGSCFCRDCQAVSGGGPAYGLIVAREAFTLHGQPRAYRRPAASGAPILRWFCPDCGTPLWAESELHPQLLSLRAGTLDDPATFAPRVQVWTSSRQPWHRLDPALPSFEHNPPMARPSPVRRAPASS